MPEDFSNLIRITNPDALSSFTEEQIVRDPNSANIFLAQGVNPVGDTSMFELPNQGSTTEVVVDDVLDASQLGGNSEINTVGEVPQFDLNAFVSGLDTTTQGTQDFLTQLNQPTEQLQEERTGLGQQLQSALNRLTGRTERVQELTGQTGLTGLQQELSDLTTQIASRRAEFEGLIEDLPGQGRGITSDIISGQQARLRRQAAVELGGLASVAQAVQGNIATAQDLINRTIQAEYQPVLDEIATLKEQLAINFDNLSLAEQRRASQLNIILNERERLINQQLTEKENISQIMIEASKKGVSADVLNQIRNSANVQEAILNAQKAGVFTATDGLGSFQRVGTDEFGDPVYGFVNENTGQIFYAPSSGGAGAGNMSGIPGGATGQTVTDASGATYDIGTYATDQQHESSVQSILDNIGQMTSIEQMDNYIQSVAPDSPITGEMIAKASEQYGTSWETMMAIMQQDSNFADPRMDRNGVKHSDIVTGEDRQRAVKFFNPGNVGNVDSGSNVDFGDWQAGVNAVAQNLARRRISQTQEVAIDPEIQSLVNAVNEGRMTAAQALDQIPQRDKQKRQELLTALGNTQTAKQEARDLELAEKATEVENLAKHAGLAGSVGSVPFFGTLAPFTSLSGDKQDFLSTMDSLLSEFALESLISSKERGATYGQLSNQELRIISAAATKLNAAANRGDDGKLKGFKMSEGDFKTELENISKTLRNQIKNKEFINANSATYDPLGILGTVNSNNSTNPLGL